MEATIEFHETIENVSISFEEITIEFHEIIENVSVSFEEIIDNVSIEVTESNEVFTIEFQELGVPGIDGKKGDIGLEGIKGDIGITGAKGKSAYQSALDGGFVGTELDWVISLTPNIGDKVDRFENQTFIIYQSAIRARNQTSFVNLINNTWQ